MASVGGWGGSGDSPGGPLAPRLCRTQPQPGSGLQGAAVAAALLALLPLLCGAGSARRGGCRIFLFFLVSTLGLVVERFVYPDRMSLGLALILQIIHLQL